MKNITKIAFTILLSFFFSTKSKAAVVAYYYEKNNLTSLTRIIDNNVYSVTTVNGGYDNPNVYTVQNIISFTAMKSQTTDNLSLYFTIPGSVFTTGQYSNPFSLTRSPGISGRTNLTGWFKILEIEWVPIMITDGIPGWSMTKLALDFHQEGPNGYSIDGGIRYGSGISLNVIPESSNFMLFTLAGGLVLIRRKR